MHFAADELKKMHPTAALETGHNLYDLKVIVKMIFLSFNVFDQDATQEDKASMHSFSLTVFFFGSPHKQKTGWD